LFVSPDPDRTFIMSTFENFWANKSACDDAERAYYEKLSGCKSAECDSEDEETVADAPKQKAAAPANPKVAAPAPKRGAVAPAAPAKAQSSLADKKFSEDLRKVDGLVSSATSSEDMALVKKLNALEVENKSLKKVTDDLKALVLSLEARVGQLEGGKPAGAAKPAPAAVKPAPADDDDDDVDLFGSDDEEDDEEKKRITEERLAAYAAKKAKKPQVIAKTSVLLDIKPWDDETDHNKMLESVKSIEMDGLLWGASKLIPIGYGIKKLQVMCTVEDEKVSVDELSEKIEEFEDYVQSVDVAAMNKI